MQITSISPVAGDTSVSTPAGFPWSGDAADPATRPAPAPADQPPKRGTSLAPPPPVWGASWENVPEELRAINQWVLWTYVVRDGKRTKVPVDPAAGRPSDATDPATWLPFDEACRIARERGCWIGLACGP